MKRVPVVLGLAALVVFAIPLVLAGGQLAGKTHDATVEVVAVDLEASTLTFKNKEGEKNTVPVLKEAQSDLKLVKAGEAILITCLDDANGKHLGISNIKSPQQKSG